MISSKRMTPGPPLHHLTPSLLQVDHYNNVINFVIKVPMPRNTKLQLSTIGGDLRNVDVTLLNGAYNSRMAFVRMIQVFTR